MYFLEIGSLIFGIAFIILAIFERSIAWVFGLFSSLFLLIIYIHTGFIFNSALMGYYIAIALYGFITWRKRDSAGDYQLTIKQLTFKQNIAFLGLGLILSLLFFISIKEIGQSPLLDSMIFSFSVIATFLQVKKYIDNWFYWIILNILSTIMMALCELYWLSLLMFFYIIMAIIGYIMWKKTNLLSLSNEGIK